MVKPENKRKEKKMMFRTAVIVHIAAVYK